MQTPSPLLAPESLEEQQQTGPLQQCAGTLPFRYLGPEGWGGPPSHSECGHMTTGHPHSNQFSIGYPSTPQQSGGFSISQFHPSVQSSSIRYPLTSDYSSGGSEFSSCGEHSDHYIPHTESPAVQREGWTDYLGVSNESGYNNQRGQANHGARPTGHETSGGQVEGGCQPNELPGNSQRSDDLGTGEPGREVSGPSLIPKPRPRKPRTMIIKSTNADSQASQRSRHCPQVSRQFHHSQSEEPLSGNKVVETATDFMKQMREIKMRADESLKRPGSGGPKPEYGSDHVLSTSRPTDPGPQGILTDPGPQGVPTDPGPQGILTDPGPQGILTDPGPQGVLTGMSQKPVPISGDSTYSPSDSRPVRPLIRRCSKCTYELNPKANFCCLCGTPAHPHTPPTGSSVTPEPATPPLPPKPGGAPARPPKTSVTPSEAPPQPKPWQMPPGPAQRAWEDPTPTDQQPTPPLPQRPHPHQPSETTPTQSSEAAAPPIPPKPHPHDSMDEEFLNMPGVSHLIEKQKAFQDKQRRDGVREQDIQPLGELEERKQEFRGRKRRTVDPKQFPVVRPGEATIPSAPPEEVRRMEDLASQGRALLDSLKECVPLGYSLDEIQIAYNQSGRGEGRSLHYLQTEWREMTEQARRNLSLYKTPMGYHVGTPTAREMKEALARERGDVRAAEQAVFQDRQIKVKQLLSRVAEMRKNNEDVPELTWQGAVSVLSRNNMDVDAAYYVLQSDWLKPLYDYIFDEKNTNVLINQKEMEAIKKVITNEEVAKDYPARLLMAECKFHAVESASIVLELVSEVEGDGGVDHPLQYYIDAAKDHKDIEKARGFFIQECSICYIECSVHEFVALPGCNHSICKHCFRQNFEVIIREKEVKHFICPVCGKPDMGNEEITNGVYLEIFVHMIHEHLDEDMYQLCLKKLRDFNLIKEYNFLWCSNNQCQSGFIHEGRAIDVQCPHCEKMMCRKCKKPWELAHEGISCEAFAQWKIDNDPDAQEQGLAAHLQANGIECPGCHFRYDLARGGCMHFKCVKCPNEFCSGCGQSFKQGQECGKLESCKTKGLHAHHPRDCLFYLRDFDVEELQGFLQQHKIAYDTEPKEAPAAKEDKATADQPAEQEKVEEPAEPAPAVEPEGPKGCRVMLQKETMEGLRDEECGRDVLGGHAGLCVTHYKEYLVDLINRNKLDPITMYETLKVELMLQREEMAPPERDDEDDDDEYRTKLMQHVKQHLPLPHGPPLAVPDPQPPAPS